MNFSDELKKIGTSKEAATAHQQGELNKFQEELRPAKEFAKKAIAHLEKFFRENSLSLIAAVEQAGVSDLQLGRHLAELKLLSGRPQELKLHLEELRRVRWAQISSPPYKGEISLRRRADLARHLKGLLMGGGDIEGAARGLINRIESRVAMLAARAGGDRDAFPFILPDQPARPVRVVTNQGE